MFTRFTSSSLTVKCIAGRSFAFLLVSGERAAVADSCGKADLQSGEDSARQTGKTQEIQGENDTRTHT